MYEYDKYELYMKSRPHVVLLGAGASCAAIPNGDENGKKISAMNGFIEKLGLSDILSSVTIKTKSDNLEDIYMELDERSAVEKDCMQAKEELETRIRNYMNGFIIPKNPTVYDFLIMSLTNKDLIATFNWDPLLVQSYERLKVFTNNLPRLAFLHGNVAVGYCQKDDKFVDLKEKEKFGKTVLPMKLLYPTGKKDYNSDIAIAKSWREFKTDLQSAYMFTIFGYSAPKSDVEALKMMKKAWGRVEDRNLEEIEIIDIRSEDDIINSWSDFIHTHHYSCHNSFFDSSLAKFPRRTCEATFDRLMKCSWLHGGNGFTSNMSFEDIRQMTQNLILEEIQMSDKKKPLSNPYSE